MSSSEENEKRSFEIGWEFVQEYYTIMHNEPQSLYKFYGNNSYYCNGIEGESTPYCHGKEEIKKRISDINYRDCKVIVSNVDSQPSANGGIIIQVLGEMENRDEQAIKFNQTFFLAVQENGFYVLNDIFRHLKDEVNEECEELIQQAEEEQEEEVKEEPEKVEEPPAKPEKTEVKETKPAPAESKPAPSKEKKSNEAANKSQQTSQKSAAKEAPAKETAETQKPATAKAAEKPAANASAQKPATAPAASNRPMTYSSIASSSANTTTGTKTWSKIAQGDGSKAAVVVKQTIAAPQKHQDNNRNNNNNNNNNNQDKDSHTVFIKLPFNVSKDELSGALNKFGDIKNIEINVQKNYAFVEFATVEQARKAVQGGEFTIKNTKINIEERKRNNKNHGNGRMNSSYNNRGGRSDYNRNYSGGSRGSNDSNNMGNRRGGSNNGKRPYKN